MSKLFSPFIVKGLTFKNRIVMSPMCQYASQDGFANNWHLVHLGSRALGGVGLIIQEATAVHPDGRISPQDLGIWKDEHIDKLKEVCDFVHQNNTLIGIQLAHAGRKASTAPPWKGYHQYKVHEGGWQTVAPSSIAYKEGDHTPSGLTENEIDNIVLDFKNAAIRSIKAGYDLIEIHAAHGYLIHQFLSPLSNKRKDGYGGTFENRIKFLIAIIVSVKEVMPDNMPLFLRISATDWADRGWDLEQSIALSKIVKELGVDLIDVSTGALVSGVRIPIEPGYQVPFAKSIKEEADIATGAVGLITEGNQAELILQKNEADLIFIARKLLYDPHYAYRMAEQLNEQPLYPVRYERAI